MIARPAVLDKVAGWPGVEGALIKAAERRQGRHGRGCGLALGATPWTRPQSGGGGAVIDKAAGRPWSDTVEANFQCYLISIMTIVPPKGPSKRGSIGPHKGPDKALDKGPKQLVA